MHGIKSGPMLVKLSHGHEPAKVDGPDELTALDGMAAIHHHKNKVVLEEKFVSVTDKVLTLSESSTITNPKAFKSSSLLHDDPHTIPKRNGKEEKVI